jgi:hypothetical protein
MEENMAEVKTCDNCGAAFTPRTEAQHLCLDCKDALQSEELGEQEVQSREEAGW